MGFQIIVGVINAFASVKGNFHVFNSRNVVSYDQNLGPRLNVNLSTVGPRHDGHL
jgi:hypothetical protein